MNQNGFDSDEQEAYFLMLEERRQMEEYFQTVQYQEMLGQLSDIAIHLGIDHCIDFLQSLKDNE